MKLKYYEIDENELLEKIGKNKKVIIKIPEGFINYSSKILKFLKENGIEGIISADTFYGACDFTHLYEYKTICIGEAEIPYLKKFYKNVSFIEARYDFNVKFLEKAIKKLNGKVGIVSITPFIHKIYDCKKFLERKGIKIYIGKKSRRTKYDGQILGCDFSSATSITKFVDKFLFIGDGLFHAIGLSIATSKKVIIANPINEKIMDNIDEIKERIMKQRYALIAKAMDAKKFGIIIGEKIGQKRIRLAKEIKKIAEKNGKEAYLLMANNITNYIDYFDFDCFISTACPRVAIDDLKNFKKPLLTPIEFEILMGERDWDNYEFDQIF